MRSEAPGPHHDWLDDDAGPVVRPYTVTGGRVQPSAGRFDLMAFVVAGPPDETGGDGAQPQPEQRAIIARAQQPITVADLAADLNLPVGVVRVLLGDLLGSGRISMYDPPTSRQFPDDDILKAVVDGLRAL
ncbi:DUF742 domain-containing protein [Micromonospora sp. WMMD1102]|uniref:DUF742 domain-containing protein n=1 Tax=Micromonosporaceae TaxID=28056 RepID=UPI0024152885|nr:DUF742 domain-containing protein [Micromonospora sp. WMMD1102]MDG4789528.1 DUF742 domain-containing protein [Micromonospora sp. WMMD1102]